MRLFCGLVFSLIANKSGSTRAFKSPSAVGVPECCGWRKSKNIGGVRSLLTSLSAGGATSSTSEIRDEQIQLSNGVSLQVMSLLPPAEQESKKQRRPVLLFLHGSFHAAWCWTEKWFPYFCHELGYPCVALSWRGTGGTYAGDDVKKVKIMEHVEDLDDLLTNKLPGIVGKGYSPPVKPVVISHSFGGLAVMKLLEKYPERANNMSGIITMCSVPPSGNGEMTMRFLRRSIVNSWKITAGLAMKRCIKNPKLCRDLFFDDDDDTVTGEDIERYQHNFGRDTVATIDLLDLAKILPKAKADADGRAPFVVDGASDSNSQLPPRLVIGATDDFIVDAEGVIETGKYFGVWSDGDENDGGGSNGNLVFVESPHDVMLGQRWRNCADTIHRWITSQNIEG